MRYRSTRDAAHTATLSEAIRRGLAPDGGLYVPERLPRLATEALAHLAGEDAAALAAVLLRPWFAGDALEDALPEICRDALSFPLPLRRLGPATAVLELFHGPTAAFKDVGARFLAACLQRRRDAGPLTVLVATSGDTGGAVAAAFHGRPGVEVVVLFPRGMVSPRQEKQLTTWGGNVRAFAVRGDFDACQRMAKQALADTELARAHGLTSANSINLGRLLPQMVPFALAGLRYRRETGRTPGFIVPSGNLGNAVAGLWSREAGAPVGEVVLATNANRAVSELLDTGEWAPQPTRATLATAMDVGAPSNVERLLHLFGGPAEAAATLRAFAVDDAAIREQIRIAPERWGEVWDPHTATAAAARERVSEGDWVLVATAHPAKFEQVVEPLIGRTLPVPPALAAILERPGQAPTIEATVEALRRVL